MKDKSSQRGDVVAGRFAPERDTDATMKRTRPISSIFQDIIAHIEEIMRSEIRLAKTEISDEIGKVAKKSVRAGAALVVFLYALGFLLLGSMFGLAQIIPLWLSALVVGGVLAATAAFLWKTGIRSVSEIQPRLEKTNQTLKEDIAWIKKPTS